MTPLERLREEARREWEWSKVEAIMLSVAVLFVFLLLGALLLAMLFWVPYLCLAVAAAAAVLALFWRWVLRDDAWTTDSE